MPYPSSRIQSGVRSRGSTMGYRIALSVILVLAGFILRRSEATSSRSHVAHRTQLSSTHAWKERSSWHLGSTSFVSSAKSALLVMHSLADSSSTGHHSGFRRQPNGPNRKALPFTYRRLEVVGRVHNRIAATNVTMVADAQASARE